MSNASPTVPRIRVRSRSNAGPVAPASRVWAIDAVQDEETADLGSLDQTPAAETQSYAVGYKRPPRHTRFQKGKSGNPKGRPKGALNLSTIVTKTMSTRRSVRIDGRDMTMSGAEIMVQQQAKKAMTGDPRAAKFITELLMESEAKADLAATVSKASAAHDEPLSETEAAILVDHYRTELANEGVNDHAIDAALAVLGLLPKRTDR